ncbi:lysoplasmalogenase [Fusibacter sp. 3D3]|uniref:lysoplasmalogenase n=1 Tax=Fusibacter sp. 3D3 TaxID=1048380 RepID=UPI000853EC9D|nr:lysoplasmalogenase [Fusibacter sp. 3D3]GAU79688.1 putative membrane protein [Fusibacter sp. 3D3]
MKYMLIPLLIIVSVLNVYSQKPSDKGSIYYWIKTITKPLIMPLIIAIYLSFSNVIEPLLILAFAFGWFGDIALMLHINVHKGTAIQSTEKTDIIPLMLGMLFFLGGHITYIFLFAKEAAHFTSHIIIYTAIYLIYILYAFMMFKYLSSHGILKQDQISPKVRLILKVAISMYMLAITLMSFMSFLRYMNDRLLAKLLCFIGSLIFITSDSVLSISTLGQNEKMSERYIMGSYIIAQTLIMMSYLLIV